MAQQYVAGNKGVVDALVLYGATVLRKYRETDFGVPVLTLDGDLDGLLRATRQAEAYYHQVLRPSQQRLQRQSSSPASSQPVILLEGLNHWSISSGPVPSNVKKHDLPAEVGEEQGHQVLATALTEFIVSLWGRGTDQQEAAKSVVARLAATQTFVQPIIDALALEGSSHLNIPCESDHPTNPTCEYPKFPDKSTGPPKPAPKPLPPSDCTCGSEWIMQNAQRMMAGLDFAPLVSQVEIVTKDAFHDVSDTRPFHLPHIFEPAPGSTCLSNTSSASASSPRLHGAQAKCVIQSTTVTMPILDKGDSLDTGLAPVSASEFRTKLKSRQAVWQTAGVPEDEVPFNVTDRYNTSICQSINALAYEWALASASPVALKRFKSRGVPLEMVADTWSKIGVTGPTWIKDALKFTPSKTSHSVQVAAPYFATENKKLGDVSYLETVGYHYCKLLSPARAMEWIYIDALADPLEP